MYEEKFGKGRVTAIAERMRSVGLETTPPIHFSYGGKMSNTMRSHRLIHFASKFSTTVQNDVVEELMVAYFEKEEDIGSLDVLINAAMKAGLPVSDVELKQYLESNQDEECIKNLAVDLVQKHQISGVPHFLISGPSKKAAVGGAQDADVFSYYFSKL